MKIGVLGGTFDPVHLGHLILAEEARYQLELKRILWVLTPEPPHKAGKTILRWEDRWCMLDQAVAGNKTFEMSDVDIQREPPYYAVDTMRLLKEEFPRDQLIYLIGSDSLNDLPEWQQPRRLVDICDGLGIMIRPGITIDYPLLEEMLPGIQKKLIIMPAKSLDISSSNIRSRIASGHPYRYFLPPAVYDYIEENNLYLV